MSMIYLVRHGETDKNRSKELQGRRDVPLNEKGLGQAAMTGKWFASNGITFSHVFSSPLERAVKTAQLCAGDVPVQTDERLIEMDYGPYEGTDLRNPPPEIVEFFRDFVHNPAPKGMEQLSDVVTRTGTFLEEVKTLDGNILAATHAIALKGCLEYLTPDAHGRYWSVNIRNCAVYRCEVSDGKIGLPVPVAWEKLK